MFRKSFIALAVTATIATGIAASSTAAEAKTFINVGLGFGGFGGFGGYGGYGGYYGGYYPGYCGYHWAPRRVWNWNHTYKIWVNEKVPFCY